MKRTIWEPQAKQKLALERSEFEILYGGARGGGKTDAGMAWLAYGIGEPRFRGLVIRLNAKDLNDWVDRARWMYTPLGAEFVGSPTEIRFPSGAVIRTGHLKDENAYTQYQGHEYQRILIEELTQIPQEKYYEQLISSCRSTIPTLKGRVFATTNPGNLGHAWVKKRFDIPNQPDFKKVYKHPTEDRVFIPARIEDNKKLIEKDESYQQRLEQISDNNLRQAWRYGDWGDPEIEGAIYKHELAQAKEFGRITKLPHDPRHPVYTYWDIGIGDSTAILFMQKVGGAWHMIDYYEDSGKSLAHYVQVVHAKGYYYSMHFGPFDLENKEWSSGRSRKSIAADLGLYYTIVPKMPIEDGINAVRMKFPVLWIDEEKCLKFLDAISAYRYEYDEKKLEYRRRPLHDWTSHAADALRYWAIAYDPVEPNVREEEFSMFTTEY